MRNENCTRKHATKRKTLVPSLLVILAAALIVASTAQAQAPSTVSYQGRLTTPVGVPVADGTYSIAFRIYDDSTAGNLFWEEVKSVTTKNGLFSVVLGQSSPLDQGTLSIPNLFLAIKVGAGAELTPRRPLASVPYASMVSTVEGATGGMINGDLSVNGQVFGGSSTGAGGLFQTYKTTDGNQYGVMGKFAAPTLTDGIGVYGYSKPADNYGIGGVFDGGWQGVNGNVVASDNNANSYLGVYGEARATTPQLNSKLFGVYGAAYSANECYGVYGDAQGSASSIQSTFYGVYCTASGSGALSKNYGAYATATGGAVNYGIYASGSNYAGFFNGNVGVLGNLSKLSGSFKIDHPLDPANKYLQHSFVESPDMMNIYNGNTTLDADGKATVTMPEWFDALNRDFRYQLTAIGAPGPNLYISKKVTNNQFSIAGGTGGMEVSWQVTGVRKDVWAEAYRIQVEVPKDADKVGTYITPELFGKPVSMGENYEMTKRAQDASQPATLHREKIATKRAAEVKDKK